MPKLIRMSEHDQECMQLQKVYWKDMKSVTNRGALQNNLTLDHIRRTHAMKMDAGKTIMKW
jgi:hypothetical protein